MVPRWHQDDQNMCPKWTRKAPRRPQESPLGGPSCPKTSESWPTKLQGGTRGRQESPKAAQDGPKMPQGSPQDAPGGPRLAPRWPKRAPGWPQEGPKMAPRGPKMNPRWRSIGKSSEVEGLMAQCQKYRKASGKSTIVMGPGLQGRPKMRPRWSQDELKFAKMSQDGPRCA